MCGLVGVITGTPNVNKVANKNFFTQALFMDTLRGFDATGVLTVEKGRVEVFKRAMPAYDYLCLPTAKGIIERGADNGIIIGHNRAKTKGTNTNENAHPHTHGPITLVHNGTLTNHSSLTKSYEAVDTVALTKYLADHTIQEMLDKVEGAYTIIWHDSRDNTINFFSNGKRPFAFAQASNKKGWYFASEDDMLVALLNRNNIAIADGTFVTEADVNTHYQWNCDKLEDKPTLREYKPTPKALPPARSARSGNAGGSKVPFANNQEPSRASLDLSDTGVRYGQRVDCWAVGWDRFNREGVYGKISGYMMDHPHCDVILAGVTKATWDKHDEQKGFSGKVVGAYRDHNDILILRLSDFKELEVASEKKPEGSEEAPPDDTENEIAEFCGPTAKLLTRKEWEDLTKHGCDNCCDNILESDHDKIAWTNGHRPICTECTKEMVNWGVLNDTIYRGLLN